MVDPLILPSWLKPGDRLYVVLPSGGDRLEKLQAGINVWQQWGYEVMPLLPSEESRLDYLAGTDPDRLSCLQTAMDDESCRAILCGRGGYGATRLLPNLDWSGFARSPKWMIGFSDITALLWATAARGVASIHGPIVRHMPLESSQSQQRLLKWCQKGQIDELQGTTWQRGVAEGILMPANLTVATAMIGTPDWPLGEVLADKPIILALEDINELPYRLDRMLTQWQQVGAFEKVVGIALGRFSWEDPWDEPEPYSAEGVLRDRLLELDIPIVANLEFGHGDGDNLTLPVGVNAQLDGESGCLSVAV